MKIFSSLASSRDETVVWSGVASNPENGYIFKRPPFDGGGFITDFTWSADGRDLLCCTDVFNGYVRRAGEDRWTPLLETKNLPHSEFDPPPKSVYNGRGLYAARFAPSDKRLIYAVWRGRVYRVFRGQALPTSLIDKTMLANNGASRRFGGALAVHPTDSGVVVVGTNGDGAYATRDGFASAPVMLDLPQTAIEQGNVRGKTLFAFAPDGGLYAHVFGTGLFFYPTGPFGPVRFLGGPLNSTGLKLMPSGDLFTVHYRFGSAGKETPTQTAMRGIWRLRGGDWTHLRPGEWVDQVAVDPSDEQRMLSTDEDSQKWFSSQDGGETWRDIGDEYRGDGEVAWMSNRKKAMYPSKIDFHPLIPGRLVISDGIGLTWANYNFERAGDLTVHDMTRGIYEFVPTCGWARAGQPDLLLGCMDKAVWRVDPKCGLSGEWTYAPKDGKRNESAVTHLRSIDGAIDDPRFVAGLFHQSGGVPGYSEDFAASWIPFGRKPDGSAWLPGGCIAVSNRDTMLLAEGNKGGLWRTRDGGVNWLPVGFGGVTHVRSLVNAFYVARKCIAADKERPGTFAVLMNTFDQPGGGPNLGGLWVTADGGATFEQVFDGALHSPGQRNFEPSQFWQCRLEYVPGRAGELLYASETEARDSETLLWSRDGGRSWRSLSAYRIASWAFGKGKGDGPDARPAIWFYGFHDGVRGLYVTYDWFATAPKLVSRFPLESISTVGRGLCLVGDMNRAGRCAIGLGGASWAICEPS
ncbi:beta propeller repeat protein [Tsuneonella amylolytica]|uniref:hypothetical protein n=1 Tax=Tsuneonella amylolytica TaxID=2338327 RepID=UPI0013C4F54F|nr:hypothetical protein [Tsuneonella amylolytica]